jgi:hypothetical protein
VPRDEDAESVSGVLAAEHGPGCTGFYQGRDGGVPVAFVADDRGQTAETERLCGLPALEVTGTDYRDLVESHA